MKRYILLLAIIVSSCTTHPTTPSQPAHPFPQSFKEVSLTFQNLPEHWDNEWQEYGRAGNLGNVNSGTGPDLSGTWVFDLVNPSFNQSGDTIAGSGSCSDGRFSFTLVVNSDSGVIDTFQFSYAGSANVGTWYGDSSYGVAFHHVAYQPDSAINGGMAVKLSGQSIQSALSNLTFNFYGRDGTSGGGTTYSAYNTYEGTVGTNASLAIRFIP